MSILTSDYIKDPNYKSWYACMAYILLKVCKKTNKHTVNVDGWEENVIESEYKEIYQPYLKWIIDRANYLASKWYQMDIVPNVMFSYEDNMNYVPEMYPAIKKNYNYNDHLCVARIKVMNNVIFRYKLYGRYVVWIGNHFYYMKRTIRKWIKGE